MKKRLLHLHRVGGSSKGLWPTCRVSAARSQLHCLSLLSPSKGSKRLGALQRAAPGSRLVAQVPPPLTGSAFLGPRCQKYLSAPSYTEVASSREHFQYNKPERGCIRRQERSGNAPRSARVLQPERLVSSVDYTRPPPWSGQGLWLACRFSAVCSHIQHLRLFRSQRREQAGSAGHYCTHLPSPPTAAPAP